MTDAVFISWEERGGGGGGGVGNWGTGAKQLREGYRMVPFNLKVLEKFGLCSNCSQKLHGCSLARARKIFATARMLAFSLTCARLLEISLISSFVVIFYTYINDKSVMIVLKQKGLNIFTSDFSLSLTVQPVTIHYYFWRFQPDY